jgi:O-acetyl-ADP-ribose deacetylase (regulator of RNase III)
MKLQLHAAVLELVQGDITQQATDAIVADFLKAKPGIELVRFVLFGQHAFDEFARAATELSKSLTG